MGDGCRGRGVRGCPRTPGRGATLRHFGDTPRPPPSNEAKSLIFGSIATS